MKSTKSSSLPDILILGNMENIAYESSTSFLRKLCCIFFFLWNTYFFLPPPDFRVGLLINVFVPLTFIRPISGFLPHFSYLWTINGQSLIFRSYDASVGSPPHKTVCLKNCSRPDFRNRHNVFCCTTLWHPWRKGQHPTQLWDLRSPKPCKAHHSSCLWNEQCLEGSEDRNPQL